MPRPARARHSLTAQRTSAGALLADEVSAPGRLAAARRREMARLVTASGALSVAELAERFGVSEMTVRRDLHLLEREGGILRARGGAMRSGAVETVMQEPSYAARRGVNHGAKRRIAEAAAKLVGDCDVIGLDVGSTVTALAERLRSRQDLGIITHNLQVVNAVAATEAGPRLYVLGGHFRRSEGSLIGPEARRELERLWLNTAFIGVAGLGAEGLFDYSPEEAEIKTLYSARAHLTCVLCDSSKFGRRSLVRFAGLETVDIVVTEAEPPADLARALAAAEVRILVAGEG